MVYSQVALASAIICKLRNPKASALHDRISIILFRSGSKHDDLVRLNRLGVCMSPKQMLRVQAEIDKRFEKKVNVLKAQIEEQKGGTMVAQRDSTETTIKKGG